MLVRKPLTLRANRTRGAAQMKLADLPRRQALPTAASLMGRLNSVVTSMDQGISASGDCWDNVDLEADLPEDVRPNIFLLLMLRESILLVPILGWAFG